jgi:hypothetical protein
MQANIAGAPVQIAHTQTPGTHHSMRLLRASAHVLRGMPCRVHSEHRPAFLDGVAHCKCAADIPVQVELTPALSISLRGCSAHASTRSRSSVLYSLTFLPHSREICAALHLFGFCVLRDNLIEKSSIIVQRQHQGHLVLQKSPQQPSYCSIPHCHSHGRGYRG